MSAGGHGAPALVPPDLREYLPVGLGAGAATTQRSAARELFEKGVARLIVGHEHVEVALARR